jgi:hypothetical protein
MAGTLQLQHAQAPTPLRSGSGAVVPQKRSSEEEERYDLTYTGDEVQQMLDEVHTKQTGLASETKNGYMSHEDKKKLDALPDEINAITDQEIVDSTPIPETR